jgi:adenylate cyclase
MFMSTSSSDNILSPDAIREALERILANADFVKSKQLSRFLTYIVEKTLEGEADELKAYTIAIEVMDRSTDFDPQFDPLVRVRAGRLRRALERYYLTDGASDPIRIEVPKGGYVPRFHVHHTASA